MSVDHMNDELIKRWNSVVKQDDTVYVLGDFIWRTEDPDRILPQLHGKILVIPGGHDDKRHLKKMNVLEQIHITKETIVLCHYALAIWPLSHYDSVHLYGHSHGGYVSRGRAFDVGVDCWDYYPVSHEKVMSIVKDIHNPNLVRRHANTVSSQAS